jgi:hypothetical protein
MVPLLSAEMLRTTSEMVVSPVFLISSAVNTVTGDSVSTSVRRSKEPVTTISASSLSGAAAGSVCADTCDSTPPEKTHITMTARRRGRR